MTRHLGILGQGAVLLVGDGDDAHAVRDEVGDVADPPLRQGGRVALVVAEGVVGRAADQADCLAIGRSSAPILRWASNGSAGQ